MAHLAVIGGSGFAALPALHIDQREQVDTPYGPTSALLTRGKLGDHQVLFLPRHGDDHHIPPHKINYRANLRALADAGVTHIIALSAVGGIGDDCGPGVLCVPDQIIDYTSGRISSFFQGEAGDPPLDHIDFTEPYASGLRAELIAAGRSAGLAIRPHGCYGATQGPRLESAAEVCRLAQDGCDLVGMTGMPEAALARELGLDYASLCFVVNWAAGLSDGPVTMAEIHRNLAACAASVERVLLALVDNRSSAA